jgi:hypothetical protein
MSRNVCVLRGGVPSLVHKEGIIPSDQITSPWAKHIVPNPWRRRFSVSLWLYFSAAFLCLHTHTNSFLPTHWSVQEDKKGKDVSKETIDIGICLLRSLN